MTPELETLLRHASDKPENWDRLKAQPWWPDVVSTMQRIAPGLQVLAIAHSILRESSGNPHAIGDNGASYGLFQINIEAGLGQNLRLEHGRRKAIEMARDPVQAARIMAGEAKRLGVHLIVDPRQQCFAFVEKVERPEKAAQDRVYRQLFGRERA